MKFSHRRQAPNLYVAPSKSYDWVHRPLISVVLPVYNQKSYLEKSIHSLLSDSKYPLELVLVNDGSTDGSEQIAEKFSRDSRVRLISQENQGLSSALNTGFQQVSGSFLSWTSADNAYLPGTLDRLASFLLANPDVGMVYANVGLIDDNGQPNCNSSYRIQDQDSQDTSHLLLPISAESLSEHNDNFINACFMYRREVRDATGAYDPDCNGLEDYEYWLRVSLSSRIAHIDTDEILYLYRLHDNSLSARLDIDLLSQKQHRFVKRSRCAREVLDKCLRFSLSPNASDKNQAFNSVLESLQACRHQVTLKKGKKGSQNEALTLKLLGLSPDTGPSIDPLVLSQMKDVELRGLSLYSSPETARVSNTVLQAFQNSRPETALLLYNADNNHSDNRLIPGLHLLPPITLPKILKRARDSSYGAVNPNANSKASVLIFLPDAVEKPDSSVPHENLDWVLTQLCSMISELKDFTFVLCSMNPAQRALADQVNLKLENNCNLRIVDLSSSSEGTDSNSLVREEKFLSSLMYVLSSVDVLVSVSAQSLDLDSFFQLRIESAIAAAAAIPLIAITKDSTKNHGYCVGDLCAEKSVIALPEEQQLVSQFLQIPHLGFFRIEQGSDASTSYQALGDLLQEVGKGISPLSADLWLSSQEPAAAGKKIASLFFSRAI